MKQYYNLTDNTHLYCMAIALHPLARTTWFVENWSNQPDGKTEMANAITAVNEYWHEYLTSRDARQAARSANTATSMSPMSSTLFTTSIPRQTTATPATVYTDRYYEMMGLKRAARSEGDKTAAIKRERLKIRGEFERFSQAELDLNGYMNEPLRW